MTKHVCEECGKALRESEIKRYDKEFDNWARKHPGWETRLDVRDRHYLYMASGVRLDCNGCAVERLQHQKTIIQNTTFIERASQGGPEGYWLVAVAILGMLLVCFAF